MPVHAHSEEYGHKVTFLTCNHAPANTICDIQWTHDSIYVPSSSVLNGPAHVWLKIPCVDIEAAKRWCTREEVHFLSPWHAENSLIADINGFSFAVTGFSRYRYVESDSDDDEVQPKPQVDEEEHARDERRRMRVRSAGRTPARRKVSTALDESPEPVPHGERPVQEVEEPRDAEQWHPRPRMMTPRFLLAEEDAGRDDEDQNDKEEFDTSAPPMGKGEAEEVDRGEDAFGFGDPFRKGGGWEVGMAAETPKMNRLRAALFEGFATQSAERIRNLRESVRQTADDISPQEDEDVNMQDVPMGEVQSLRHLEETRYSMFESPGREEAIRDAEEYLKREAGEFTSDGTIRRRGLPDLGFPCFSLPFPTVEVAIAAGKEGVFSDTGLMLGRSTRICFSHKSTLVRPQYRASQVDLIAGEGFGVDVQDVHPEFTDQTCEGLAKLLRIHCTAWYSASNTISKSDIEADGNSRVKIPSLQDAFSEGNVADATLQLLVEELKTSHHAGDVNAAHAHIAFWLLLALYKRQDESKDEDELLHRLSEWAAGPAGTMFDDDEGFRSSGLRSALLQLALGNIELAVRSAMECGHVRLGLLIARALESPKEGLRADAEAQLAVYGLIDPLDLETEPSEPHNTERWDRLLEECPDDSAVSVDEVMILLILAGHVEPVARFLGFSWYRLFIMELLYGAGTSDLTQAERVSAAVDAVTRSAISTNAPHKCARERDVVYHLLRLYAEPTANYSLTSGVYGNGSFGLLYSPMDSRFSWLLYQVLTAIIPRASTRRAPVVLADAFSAQLRAAGLHLWSFYVLCTGGASDHVLKSALIRDWPDLESSGLEWSFSDAHRMPNGEKGGPSTDEGGDPSPWGENDAKDYLSAETFLLDILNVPPQWVSEAKAIAAHTAGNITEECEHWITTGTAEGASLAHDILTTQVFPDLVATQDPAKCQVLADLLRTLQSSKHVSNWSTGGGLILEYLDHVIGAPTLSKQPLEFYRAMVDKVRILEARAKTPEQHYATAVIANGIVAAERALLIEATSDRRDAILDQVVDDLERLPCTRAVKLRVAGEYKIEAEHGTAVALRLSTAYPQYSRYLELTSPPNG